MLLGISYSKLMMTSGLGRRPRVYWYKCALKQSDYIAAYPGLLTRHTESALSHKQICGELLSRELIISHATCISDNLWYPSRDYRLYLWIFISNIRNDQVTVIHLVSTSTPCTGLPTACTGTLPTQ